MFFCSSRKWPGAAGDAYTAALNLINVNIDSIQAEATECKTNTGNMRESNRTWEMHVVEKGYANTDVDSKIKYSTNGQNDKDNVNKINNYFLSSPNVEADERKNIELTQKMHSTFGDVFNGIGCFEGTLSLQLKPDSKPYQVPQRHVAYVLEKLFK